MITYSKSLISKMNSKLINIISKDASNYKGKLLSEEDTYFLIDMLKRKSPVNITKEIKSLETGRILLYFNLDNKLPATLIPIQLDGSSSVSMLVNLAELTRFKYATIDKLSNINDLVYLIINAELQATLYNKPAMIRFDKNIETISRIFYTGAFNHILGKLYDLSAESQEVKKAVNLATMMYVNNVILEKANVANDRDILDRYSKVLKISNPDMPLIQGILTSSSVEIINNIEDYALLVSDILGARKEIRYQELVKVFITTFPANFYAFDMVQALLGNLKGCTLTGSFKYKCSTFKVLFQDRDRKEMTSAVMHIND